MFVKRDQKGEIIAISKKSEGDIAEFVADDAPELSSFLQAAKSPEQLALEQTDQAMARVLEDVVSLLVEQGVIRFTDLPVVAQDKLLNRRELRGKRKGINLLDDGDDLPL
jgi:hypothetical protein